MKKLLFIFCLPFLFCACQKVFKEDAQNKLLINNTDDLAYAIAGLQNRFSFSVMNTYDLIFLNSDELTICNSMLLNQNIPTGGGSTDNQCGTRVANKNYTNSIIYLWRALYENVICANSIFQKSSKLSKNDPAVTQMLGEVYFLRAYTYFRLVRYFGEVPIVDNMSVSFTVKKSGFAEVYNLIINDLENAIAMLPATNMDARVKYATPFKGTAKALLAEVYLSMGGYPLKQPEMYTMAATISKEVIANSDVLGYTLLPDMADLWKHEKELNSESEYALYFNDHNSDTIYDNSYYVIHNQDYYSNGFQDLTTSARVGPLFYNHFPSNYRRNVTFCLLHSLYFSNTMIPVYKLPQNINACNSILFRKNYNPYYSSERNFHEGRLIYMMRYAHTLLTYAEAKARSGNIDASAYEAVNQVRRRANNVDIHTPSSFDLQQGLTNDQFADSVVLEKAWEFCSEPENRIFDLLRLEMYNQLPNLRKGNNQGNSKVEMVDPSTWFFPIPELDKKLNPNLN
jgi:starch-binding outer membrane protein, SusD/RagB family